MKYRMTPIALAIALASSHSLADGLVSGQLTSEKGASLNGALISLEGTNREALSENGGRFRIPQVKAGDYHLVVTQGGKLIAKESIRVEDDKTTQTRISIDPHEADEEVLVIGQAAQLQRALDRQRFADNTISAVDSDAIGQLPDANAAEALQRIPGLSIERDQGEGRFVRVRGIGAELNAVTVNGAQIPAPEAGARAVALDVVPSALLSSLTVTKTLTPDMDANSIGGTIDIKSISALDHENAFYSASVQASRDGQSNQNSPAVSVSGGNSFTFEDGQRFGVAAALSYDNRKFGSDNVETGGAWDLEDGEDLLEEIEMREYSIERTRLGAALNLEYELNDNTRFYLNNLYSSFKDDEQRLATVAAFYETVIENGEEEEEDIAIAPGSLSTGEVERELKDREETQTIQSTLFGGEHFINDWTVEYKLGLSKASEDQPNGISGAIFKGDFDSLSYNNSRKPVVVGSSAFYDASEYEIDEIEVEDSYTEDEQTLVQFDISRDLIINDQYVVIKGGVKSTMRSKSQDVDIKLYDEFEGTALEEATLDAYRSASVDYSLGDFGPGISKSAVRNALADLDDNALNPEDSQVDSQLEDYEIDEDITAAYLMGTFDLSDSVRVIAGVRHESTSIESAGNAVALSENDEGDDVISVNAITGEQDYSHTLPALITRIKLNDSTQVRAAYTNSVVRPTFEQMRPNIEDDNGEAELGNPNLNALESMNLDLGIEHYMGSASVLSAAVFSKSIDNFIYETELKESPEFADYDEVKTFLNGDEASLTGIELAASHKFGLGFLVSANATFTNTEATISAFDEGETLERDIQLPNQSDVTGNLVLGFENSDFSVRLATNYKSKYLLEVGDIEDSSADIYAASQTQVDLNASYNATDNLKLTFEIANLTDEPYYTYQKEEKYNAQHEAYGPVYKLGVRFSQF